MKQKRHWLIRTLYLLTIGIVLTMKFSCRKFDAIDKTHLDDAAITEKFFTAHKSDNQLTQTITAYFLRQNSKTGIATKIASKYGIAYWDKTLLFQSGNYKQNGRTSSDSSSLVAYIPLLLATDTTVNAQLTVKLTTTDTIFEVLTSQQYAKFGFLPTDSSKLNGLKIFTMFANHDKNIFGYKKFKILDNRILQGQTNFTVNMNKNYMVELDTTTSSVSGRTFMLASPTPLPHSSCLIVKDYENAGYWVNYTMVGGVCVISSYGLNDDFTGDNGGNGGGGGGGASTPPAWEPYIPPFNINNPCEVVDSLAKTANFKNHLKDLRDSTILSFERGVSFNNPLNPSNYTSQTYTGQNSPDSLMVDIVLTQPTDGIMHNHNNSPDRLHNFSAEDIYKIAYYWSTGNITNFQTFTSTVVTDSTAYLLMITDQTQFINFVQSWFDSKEHFEAFGRYLYGNNHYGDIGNSIAQDEINFLKALQAPPINGGGFKVFKGSADMSTFSPIKLNSAGQVRPDPCN